jgi:hypothetical protein
MKENQVSYWTATAGMNDEEFEKWVKARRREERIGGMLAGIIFCEFVALLFITGVL